MEVNIGDYLQGQIIETEERSRQYRVSLSDEFPSSADYLVIKAAPLEYGSDPDVYVYKGTYDTVVRVCSKFGADDCFIHLDGESANTLFLFEIKCP